MCPSACPTPSPASPGGGHGQGRDWKAKRPEFLKAAPLGVNAKGAPIRKTRKKTRSKQKNLRKVRL